MLQANLDEEAISSIYSIPFKVTKDKGIAIFEFKIVRHILATNATLSRDKKKKKYNMINVISVIKRKP